MALTLDGTAGITANPGTITVTSGTVTTSTPIQNDTQTWNASGVTFTGWKVNITDTASASGSLLADLQVGGSSKFSVRKDGAALASDGTVGSPGITFASDTDTGLYRIGANNIGVGVNGAKVLDIGTTGLGLTGNLTSSGTNASAAFGGTLSTWSGLSGIELGGSGASFAGGAGGDNYVMCNAYYNGAYKRKNATKQPTLIYSADGAITMYASAAGTADSNISWTSFFGGDITGTGITTNRSLDQLMVSMYASGTAKQAILVYAPDVGASTSPGQSTLCVGRTSSTLRSINASGTVNASGTDYAEYESKNAECGTIAKGQIIGFDINGKITDKWAEAKSFGVKSTNPSYVGGDAWGYDLVDMPPIPQKPGPGASEEDQTSYLAAKALYELAEERQTEAREVARQKMDRIAYSGKVPVNGITSFNVGDYIIPVQDGDGIGGIAVTEPTFDQYRKAVGQVRRVLPDGRPEIAVKVG